MTDIQKLQQQIIELEARLKIVEDKLNDRNIDPDNLLMDEIYLKSRNIVIRYQKASPVFLQKKLMIDFPRARLIIDRLEREGIISSIKSDNSRDILVTK